MPTGAPTYFRGLSPPTRGSPRLVASGQRTCGSIPAHTGKPRRASSASRTPWVYPRPHGEARQPHGAHGRDQGLSPPTRGSPRQADCRGLRPRSIPAHTGKPGRTVTCATCGDTGLSPPTRGSRLRPEHGRAELRSIPAHTGKPFGVGELLLEEEVYPRPHGEARVAVNTRPIALGLSPPTRGSRECAGADLAYQGSIPAHTGKPPETRLGGRDRRVYPRPHGEALSVSRPGTVREGLSPPTRGSRSPAAAADALRGSIPAHTGKPRARRPATCG